VNVRFELGGNKGNIHTSERTTHDINNGFIIDQKPLLVEEPFHRI
jgi:hypothetical protein